MKNSSTGRAPAPSSPLPGTLENSSTGHAPGHEPTEAALMQEFASYLALLTTSFAQPLSDRLDGHERDLAVRVNRLAEDLDRQRLAMVAQLTAQEADLVERLKKFADDLERQRTAAATRHEAEEAALIAKVTALASEIDRHRACVAETQGTLMGGLGTTVAPLQEAVATSTAAFNEVGSQVIEEFAATTQAVATLSGVVGKTRAAVWACVVLSLASFATTLWLGLRR